MKERMISRGDLFYYDFGERVGSVQSGERPVLVVQADDYNKNAPTVIVAAVTSVIKKRYLPSHIILGDKFGLKNNIIPTGLIAFITVVFDLCKWIKSPHNVIRIVDIVIQAFGAKATDIFFFFRLVHP